MIPLISVVALRGSNEVVTNRASTAENARLLNFMILLPIHPHGPKAHNHRSLGAGENGMAA
jgi:hypothetical protein